MRPVFLAFALLALCGCDLFQTDGGVPFARVEGSERLRVLVNGTTTLRSDSDWAEFWRAHESTLPPSGPPAVDFRRQIVLGVFYGGDLHGGCRNLAETIEAVLLEGRTLTVRVGPMRNLGPCRMIVHPLDLEQPAVCLLVSSASRQHSHAASALA